MPKMKTKKCLKGRVKLTATGKLIRHRAGRRHLQVRKNAKRRRQLRHPALIVAGHLKTYKEMMAAGT